MSRINNKGQSLVLFILIIPILLGVMALVIDMGNALVKKNEIDSVIEFVLDYGLGAWKEGLELVNDAENLEENVTFTESDMIIRQEDLEVLLNYNLEIDKSEIIIKDGEIIITGETYVEGIFSRILNFRGFPIKSEHKGYIENGKKVIEKIK